MNEQEIKTETKKKRLLDLIDKKIKNFNVKQLENYEKNLGPGLFKRIKRILFAPKIVFYFEMKKLKFFFKKEDYLFANNYDLLKNFIYNLDSLNELLTFKYLVKNFIEDDIFYDIGAAVGLYTSLALEFCKEVHSFEPLPTEFAILEKCFNSMPNVFLNQIAISDKEGFVEIFTNPTSIVKEIQEKYSIRNSESFKVKAITLDNYINSKKNKPTIIKMDIEGAEHLVIKGGINFFENNSPIIIVEVLGDEFLENSLKAVNLLKDLGYQIYKIDLNGDLIKINYKELKFAKGVKNYIFKK